MTGKSGPEAAPAPVSPPLERVRGLATLVTSGRIGYGSSASAALQRSLASRLVQRLDTAGSTLFNLTWRERTTPLGRRYLERAVSVRRTSGKDFTSVPTPQTSDMTGGGQAKRANGRANLNDHVMLATVPTPMAGSPATETYNAAGNSDYSRRIVELCAVPTPCANEDNKSVEAHLAMKQRMVERDGTGANRTAITSLQVTSKLCAVPTPCTPNGGRSTSTEKMDATGKTTDGRKHTASLEHAVKFASVTTPSARDWKDTSGMSESGVDPDGSIRSRLDQLPRQAQLAATGETATGGGARMGSGGQLDPEFSRWLLGVPLAWDAFVCTATASLSRSRRSSSKRTSKAG